MRRSLRLLAACAILGLSSAALAEQIDNPEYAQWSKYKAGTFITMQQATEMPGMAAMPGMPAGMNMADMTPKIAITTKLTEVKPDALTLEVTTSATQMGQTRDNKTTRTVPAKIEKPAATTTAPATQAVPAIKDMKEGKETLEIKGKKIDTATREFNTGATAAAAATATSPATPAMGPAHVKVWTSAEIPNGTVKTETTTTVEQMGEVKMTNALVDYNVVK